MFGNLAVLHSKHIKSKRLFVLPVMTRPRLPDIDNNHVVFANNVKQLALVVWRKLLGRIAREMYP